MRTTTFSDASTGGANSIAARLWVQSGRGPNHHRERLVLSTQFNTDVRGSRQVYPNTYFVRDGWETWAMPEGNNSRRAGIYYRLAAEGRNEEMRGPLAVSKGYYWTWEGLNWSRGWQPPVGGGLYEPPPRDSNVFPGGGVYTVTAVFARYEAPLDARPYAFSTRVDLIAPRHSGRVILQSPLPSDIEEVRLMLRSDTPSEDGEWRYADDAGRESPIMLGVADVKAWITSRADVNLDGRVDQEDWDILRAAAGKSGAIHTDGDLLGDGRAGLADAFFLAARLMPDDDAPAPPPQDWSARVHDEGSIHLGIPGGGQLYGWTLSAPGIDPEKVTLQISSVEGGMQALDESEIGQINLRQTLVPAKEEERTVPLLRLEDGPVPGMRLKLQTGRGIPALTLPVSPPR